MACSRAPQRGDLRWYFLLSVARLRNGLPVGCDTQCHLHALLLNCSPAAAVGVARQLFRLCGMLATGVCVRVAATGSSPVLLCFKLRSFRSIG